MELEEKNIGKKGRITGNTNINNFNINDIVDITGLSLNGRNYKCKGLTNKMEWYVRVDEIEILEDEKEDNPKNKFNVGDRVRRVVYDNSRHGIKIGDTGVVSRCVDEGGNGDSPVGTISLKNKVMDILQKIPSTLKRILDKDLQAMYKVGFINGDLALTDKGEKEVLNHLISITATKKAISDIAREIIKEAKEDK